MKRLIPFPLRILGSLIAIGEVDCTFLCRTSAGTSVVSQQREIEKSTDEEQGGRILIDNF